MNEIIYKLRLIKYEPEQEIEQTIDVIVSEFEEDGKIQDTILSFLRENAIECKLKGKLLIFTVLLSFVLSDIACQMSPDLKENNARKIKSICEKRNINFSLVSSLTGYESILYEFIKARHSTQHS